MSTGLRPIADTSGAERTLLAMVDACLAGVILIAPWFLGGRHPLGELVIVCLAIVMAGAWCSLGLVSSERRRWTHSATEILLLLAVALVALQLLPLPAGALSAISPRIDSLLPLWNPKSSSPIHLGQWSIVSLTPMETTSGLVMLISYALIFLVTTQRVGDLADIERLLSWLAWSATLVATVGILQYVAGNGKYLWFYEHPYRDTLDAVKGPYMNQNHFAHLLALGLGPLVASIQQATGGRSAPGVSGRGARPAMAGIAYSVALGITLFAGLMSFSRGGAAAMLLATLVSVGVCYRASLLGRRFALGLSGAFLLIGAALLIHGLDRVSQRLDDYSSGSLERLDKDGVRRRLWAADTAGVKDFAIFGAGVGSHRYVYPLYYSLPSEVEYTHAECGYLQVPLEAGLAGLALLLMFITLCGHWCWTALRHPTSPRALVVTAAVSAGLAASALHSFVDFVWYIPSLVAITSILAAAALRLKQFATPTPAVERAPLPRWAFAGGAVAVCLTGVWMVGDRAMAALAAPAWDAYLTRSLSPDQAIRTAALSDDESIEELKTVLYWTPNNAVAHARLAQVCLRRFDIEQATAQNAMPLSQIRDVVFTSQFGSRAKLDAWMTKAFGKQCRLLDMASRHALRSVSLCPLLGESYLYMTDLCFLDGASEDGMNAYLAQSLAVRPYNAEVLLGAGAIAAMRGDEDKVIKYWGPVLRRPSELQLELIAKLAEQRVPLEFITQGLKPNLPAIRLLEDKYHALGWTSDSLHPLATYHAALLEAVAKKTPDGPTPDLMIELAQQYRTIGQPDRVTMSLKRAIEVGPNDFEAHHAWGKWLLEQHSYAQAEKNLDWCVARHPDDAGLRAEATAAAKGRVANESSARRHSDSDSYSR